MKVASVSDFRRDMKKYVDEVDSGQEPLVVTRSDNVSVVVMPLATYNAYTETDYLQRSPANAERLQQSLKNANQGNLNSHNLKD